MNVPFIDFSEQYNEIKDEIFTGLEEVFKKGNYILGQPEKDFESEFASYCGAAYGVGVNSGTDALHMAMRAIGVGPQDEVIVPAFTFIATVLAVSYTGAKPVMVDVQDSTYNMDPKKFEESITKNTKAVIVVHLYGQPADMDEILSIAKKHNIAVVEDACQAHGTSYKGKKVGSIGDLGCFSFYPTKSLGAFGDGGMVTTDNKEIYEKILMLRDYGRTDRYNHAFKGYNTRLDTVQAVILSAKLKRLDSWNSMRAKMADLYIKLLDDKKEIIVPVTKEDRIHIYQTFVVRVPNRDKILDAMKEKGVGVLIHYPIPLHLQEAYKDLGYKNGDFSISEEVGNSILSLPMFPHISEEQVKYVATTLKSLL